MALQSSGLPMFGADLGAKPLGSPSLQFSVACLEVIDDEGKPPSFNFLFYELPLPELPMTLDFFVANGWCNGKGKFIQSMKILKPDRSIMLETGDQPFELKESTEPFMAVNKFEAIPFEQQGVYWFQVFLAGRQVLEYPITIKIGQKPPGQ